MVEIADHGEDAFLADLAQPVFVGHVADQRFGIDLPVAGMHHRAEGRADRDRIRLRDRMGQRHEFHVERPQLQAAAERNFGDVEFALRNADSFSFARTTAAAKGVA